MKCDESKPSCDNCVKSNRVCEGYHVKLSFDVDDSRHKTMKLNSKGQMVHGFRGKPRLKESLAKRLESTSGTSIAVAPQSSSIDQSPMVQPGQSSINNPETVGHIVGADASILELNLSEISQEFKAFQDRFPAFLSYQEVPAFINNFNEDINNHLFQQQRHQQQLQEKQLQQHQRQEQLKDQDKKLQSQSNHPIMEEKLQPLLVEKNSTELLNADGENISNGLEENMILKHFFKVLMPLTDAHPRTPWPQLLMKYCDFEIAKSSFIALACIHLYETKGAQEFYRVGMEHINNTMEHLINYLKDKSLSNDGIDADRGDNNETTVVNVSNIIKNLKKKQSVEKKRSNVFAILILIHVHLLFGVFESGRSALARTFFELAAAIVTDEEFKPYLYKIDGSSTLIATISWFDTIAAVVSPDCRLSYCDDTRYGDKHSSYSTAKLMGCPGEIFQIIWNICHLRKELKDNNHVINALILNKFEDYKIKLLNFRDYVYKNSDFSYILMLKCTQCWALSTLLTMFQLIRPLEKDFIKGLVDEFIDSYNSIDRLSPLIAQMIWPVFTVSCSVVNSEQREQMKSILENLYEITNSGAVMTMNQVVKECWNTGRSWEEVLSGEQWLGSGIDLLPV
ncbi:hypothetical protein WICMUC_001671 [Wickerhamomyces mucosus]|uniref:Zn(2)-C6 fungal-type domain-containing protein n=1 Tax=Wickerhamomyces mucosus TaxID=1378264 RepID=A0A9P8TGV1_9ASCO|nr:hypothetical protein WICMUC_001671 [Wickerhamomyces mucosus]